MSPRARVILFFAGALPLAALLCAALLRLPASGRGASSYGDTFVAAAVDERRTTDVVSAINFDYRAGDTMGEEFILFTAIMGVVLLLRRSADDAPCDDASEGKRRSERIRTSDAVRVLGLALVGLTVTFGLYIITHGQLTPGGGFQGGVIVATAWLVIYLAGDARTYRRLSPPPVFEAAEALGAGSFVLLGAASLLCGLAFAANWLPLGSEPSVHSGGIIALLSVAVGIEVAAGLVLVITTFVQEALSEREES